MNKKDKMLEQLFRPRTPSSLMLDDISKLIELTENVKQCDPLEAITRYRHMLADLMKKAEDFENDLKNTTH